jgi:anthranilate 1,2-dioxygenase small subunit
MRVANVYEPQHYRHILSGVQVLSEENSVLQVRSNYMVVRTMELDGNMMIVSTGQCRDEIVLDGDSAKFKSRLYLYDSRVIETLLIIPI